MNEQLQEALVEVIEGATGGVQAGVSFLSAELPDVIHQLLLWKMVESLVMCTLGLIVLLVVINGALKHTGAGVKIDKESDTRWGNYKPTLTHDKDGDLSEPKAFGSTGLGLIMLVIVLCTINITWLKIWLAPKVYLIEYAASLVK